MWFEVDKAGLAALLEARGKSFAVFELVQNAWDADATTVSINVEAIPGLPYALLRVEDNSPKGWVDLSQSFTLYSRSARAADATKRGRFCLGDKLVLALCRSAKITTVGGSMVFNDTGKHRRSEGREKGTLFEGEIRMTRDELAEVADVVTRLIPPVTTTFNGKLLERPRLLKTFTAKLPTRIADSEGVPRDSVRQTTVEVYEGDQGGILELGIPVCDEDWSWRLNVLQKVPLKMERDSVMPAFRRALLVAAVNAMADTLGAEEAASSWVSEAVEDSRIQPDALGKILNTRFDRPVIRVPGDPVANAAAEKGGHDVISGGTFGAGGWANIRKHRLLPTSSEAFPTPKPSQAEAPEYCPVCKRAI